MATDEHKPLYSVLLNGEELDQRDILEIAVSNYLMLPDVAVVVHQFKEAEDLDLYKVGDTIEVKIGKREENTTATIFKGEIMTLEGTFKGGVELRVRAFDRAHRLQRTRHVKAFQNMTISDIVEKVVSGAGLSIETDASGISVEYVQQDNETDWEFIWRLARRIGFEFHVHDKTAHFVKPSGESVATLTVGENLHAFSPRVTATGQITTVTVNGFDPKTKADISGEAKDPEQVTRIGLARTKVRDGINDSAQLRVSTALVESSDEATQLAGALLNRYANAYVQAHGVTDGDPKIVPGAIVTVAGAGPQFNGDYRCDATKHTLTGGSMYITEFSNTPAPTVTEALGGSSNGRPSIGSQVVVGVVTNVNDDQDMGRVRVRIPALGTDNESGWARVAVPSAGKERGLMMLPVTGEEVLVAFEHGDTRRPFVLGSLFNGKDKPGAELADTKAGGFAVRSDDKVFMRSQKEMTITSKDTLTVEITKDVTEKFSGAQNTEVTQALKIKAQSITIEASTSLALKGATVDITGSGPVTIKGATVSIN